MKCYQCSFCKQKYPMMKWAQKCCMIRKFMKLPIAKRRKLMAKHAKELAEHYNQDSEWREWCR